MSGTGSGGTVGSRRAHRQHNRPRVPWARKTKVVTAIVGALLAGGSAYAATNWAVGLAGGSSGEAQSATVSNLTVAAVATPAAGNLLYPGGNGDVVLTISNPNPFPVTVTGVNLPMLLDFVLKDGGDRAAAERAARSSWRARRFADRARRGAGPDRPARAPGCRHRRRNSAHRKGSGEEGR